MPETPNPQPPRRRNVAWLWFAYTGFLFIDPVFDPSLDLWIITLAALAVFAAIFALYTRCDEDETSPRRYWLIAATFLLGLVTFPFNGGASTFFVYTASFLPFTLRSTRRILVLFAVEAAVILLEGQFFRSHLSFDGAGMHVTWPNTIVAVFLVFVIGGANIFFAEQKRFTLAQLRTAHALRDAQQENLALAAVAERERIARDLHDVLGHTLSVITLKAELAHRLINLHTAADTARAAAEIADVERLARTSLAEVREAITGYRTRGLAAEIDAARRTLEAAGVTLTVTNTPVSPKLGAPYLAASSPDVGSGVGSGVGVGVGAPYLAASSPDVGFGTPHLTPDTWDGPPPHLTPDEETVLALALREAVTNIVRHARATTCTLRLITDDGARRLIVHDNGATSAPPREGNGLRGMRARIEAIGGRLTLEAASGTRLLITLPRAAQA